MRRLAQVLLEEGIMEETLERGVVPQVPRWSSLVVRGIISVLFAIVAFAWPGITLAALTLLFGAWAFADGVTTLVVAARHGTQGRRWLLVLDGLIGIAAGVVTLLWPGITLLALVFVVGVRFLIGGIFQVATAVQLRGHLHSPVLYGLAGIASIIVGLLAFVVPGLTALALVTMLAAFALVFGVMMIVLAFRVRRGVHELRPAQLPA